jgi:hypothetical protein
VSDDRIGRKKLLEKALADGSVAFSLLLELLLPVRELRALCKRFGLSPKGGFRIDKAPPHVLAPVLVEGKNPEHIEAAVDALLDRAAPAPAPERRRPGDDEAQAPSPEIDRMLAELQQMQGQLERARANRSRSLQREAKLRSRLDQAESAQQLLAAERAKQPRQQPAPKSAGRDIADLERRLRELEQELQGFVDTDEALRRQLAADRSRMRELQELVAELEELLPKGKRRRKSAEPPPPTDDRRFRLPHFKPSFYKSLVGKDRKSVERAVQAILLFCTEGHAYPGLEVKQLGGQDTWSLRASLGLRVYFTQRPDGDVEFLELADREEQHTTLRRLKER